ncbi:Exodeoxyribonuclease I [compost metagenome]
MYDDFIGDRDRRLCEQARAADPQQLAQEQWPFDDERLPELLFRYRARNFPETLNEQEQERWKLFCQQRLSDARWGAPNTVQAFDQACEQWSQNAAGGTLEVLQEWREYVALLRKRLNI